MFGNTRQEGRLPSIKIYIGQATINPRCNYRIPNPTLRHANQIAFSWLQTDRITPICPTTQFTPICSFWPRFCSRHAEVRGFVRQI